MITSYFTIRNMLWHLAGVLAMAWIMICFISSCGVTPARASQLSDVAATIAAEGAGEGERGMLLISNTIANRARLYQKTPWQVVSQRNQYYGFTARNRAKLYKSVKAYADYLARNIMALPDNTDGALYFLQAKEKRQIWHKIKTIKYLHHTFYK